MTIVYLATNLTAQYNLPPKEAGQVNALQSYHYVEDMSEALVLFVETGVSKEGVTEAKTKAFAKGETTKSSKNTRKWS